MKLKEVLHIYITLIHKHIQFTLDLECTVRDKNLKNKTDRSSLSKDLKLQHHFWDFIDGSFESIGIWYLYGNYRRG